MVEKVILYSITNDEGKTVKYNSKLFMPIEEWREKRVKSLGI